MKATAMILKKYLQNLIFRCFFSHLILEVLSLSFFNSIISREIIVNVMLSSL